MLGYILKRLLLAVPTLFAVLTIVFVLVRMLPGDPVVAILGDQATPRRKPTCATNWAWISRSPNNMSTSSAMPCSAIWATRW